jgi:hypothetical protein
MASLLGPKADGEARISGTYVMHDDRSATMLQLTQTDNGQITGVCTRVELKAEGQIDSNQLSIIGVVDSGQIMLTLHGGFAGLGSASLAGTVRGGSIALQGVDANGTMGSSVLSKTSADDFKTYADRVRAKANAIQLDANLTTITTRVYETLANTKSWLSYAQKQMEHVPELEARYRSAESKMRELVNRERSTANGVDRSQISVAVSQGQVAADSWDVEVDSTWQRILNETATLNRNYSKIVPDCAFSESDLRTRGASQSVLDRCRAACQIFTPAKEKAASGFRVIAEARANLKTIQNDAHKRRQALVDQSTRLQ